MKKEFSNKEIVEHLNGLAAILNNEQRYDAKTVYAISKNINAFQGEYKPYEQALNSIREQYTECKDEEAAMKAGMDKQVRELQEVMTEVDLCMIPLSSLEQYHFSAQEMLVLFDMIADDL